MPPLKVHLQPATQSRIAGVLSESSCFILYIALGPRLVRLVYIAVYDRMLCQWNNKLIRFKR